MRVGIIQGRLSPPSEGFQECPKEWKREFDLLNNLNLNHIEWIVTKDSFETNPIFSEDVARFPISSICADNLVDQRIFNKKYLDQNLRPICDAAVKNNIDSVTIPLLEDSRVVDNDLHKKFCKMIKEYSIEYKQVNFLFEAELEASKLIDILSISDNFFVTYDTGNMTSCGFNHTQYLSSVFSRIKNVHLKDRTLEAQTVSPSMGDTNFKEIFNFLKENRYNGLYTLQTAREKTGDELKTILKHKNYFQELYNEQQYI